MHSRGRGPQDLRGTDYGHQLAIGLLRIRFEAMDVPVSPQGGDTIGSKAHTGSGLASLTVENAGDHRIGIMHGQAAQQRDRLFIGPNGRGPRAR